MITDILDNYRIYEIESITRDSIKIASDNMSNAIKYFISLTGSEPISIEDRGMIHIDIDNVLNCQEEDELDNRSLIGEEYVVEIMEGNNCENYARIEGIVAFPDKSTEIPLNPGEAWSVKVTGVSKKGNTLFFKPISFKGNDI